MNEGELRALIVEDLSNEMNEKFKTFKVALEPMRIGGVELDDKPVEVEARNPREAIIKASAAKGLKKGDWVATKTKSIKVVKEEVEVSEGKFVVYVGTKDNPNVQAVVDSKSEADKMVAKLQKDGKFGNIDKADYEGFKKQFPNKLNEAKTKSKISGIVSAGLSKDETLKIAQMVADAITKADGKKTVVNMKTLEEDSFDLDYDGTEYEGGSYNLYDNGDIRNMATRGSYVGNWKKDTVKDLVKFYKSADFNGDKK